MERREFVQASAAAACVGLGACRAATMEEAVARVGQIPRRKLGASGREVSVLIGAGTWDREAVEAAIRCGVNFWHKAEDWEGNVPRAILKNRDQHYCTVCVDRVRGNHETGKIDEEAHYQLVKRAVERTGLRYFDDMQFHFGYHSVAELKQDRGFVRAFERLKKAGLVRHLCHSQHAYNGNSRVPGGDSAARILQAVAEDGVYEHAQFVYSYGDDGGLNDFFALARRKGFGTVAMKTTRGAGRLVQDHALMKTFPAGATPHQVLARWLTTRAPVDTAVIQINSLGQFADTFSGAGRALRAADAEALRRLAAYADREVCRLCNQCTGACERGVPVAEILRFERYALDYGDTGRARHLYARLPVRADACNSCGACVARCPGRLRIPEKLARMHRLLA